MPASMLEELHLQMLCARDTLYSKCVDMETYIINVLLLCCEEVIERRSVWVKKRSRRDGKPTVEAYFKRRASISTTTCVFVDSFRRKLQTAMFRSTQ